MAIRALVGLGIVAPWLWFAILNRSHTVANAMVTIALVLGLVLLVALLLRSARRDEAAPEPAPVARTAPV